MSHFQPSSNNNNNKSISKSNASNSKRNFFSVAQNSFPIRNLFPKAILFQRDGSVYPQSSTFPKGGEKKLYWFFSQYFRENQQVSESFLKLLHWILSIMLTVIKTYLSKYMNATSTVIFLKYTCKFQRFAICRFLEPLRGSIFRTHQWLSLLQTRSASCSLNFCTQSKPWRKQSTQCQKPWISWV